MYSASESATIQAGTEAVVWGTDGDAVCLVYGGYNDEGEYIDGMAAHERYGVT